MMQTAQYLSSDAPIAFLPGSGLETTLTHHHNGVMTYSRYVNGSIFSVPKFQANSSTQILNMKNKRHQTEEEFFQTVHGLVKIFLGWVDRYFCTQCMIFTILLTLWNSEQKKWTINKTFLFFIWFWWNLVKCSYPCVLQFYQVSSKSDEKQKRFYY